MNINIECPISSLGYGSIGRNIIPELQKLGHKVSLKPIGPVIVESQEEKDSIELALIGEPLPDAPTIKIWHQHELETDFGDGKKYGFPIFELDTFNTQEIQSLSSVNVINCSKWAEQICHNNGILNTVGVVPLGYDPKVFYPKEMEKSDTFNILTIGKWEVRKGHYELPDIILTAFASEKLHHIRNFHETKPIVLNVCCTNPFYSQSETESWERYYIHKFKNSGIRVNFIDRLDSQNGVRSLILANHVTCNPTHAEGWGLEALETLACGRYLVTTKYGGSTEFLKSSYSQYEVEPAIDGKWFFGHGNWLRFTEDVVNTMVGELIDVYTDFCFGNLKQNTDGYTKIKDFTWENSANKLLSIME